MSRLGNGAIDDLVKSVHGFILNLSDTITRPAKAIHFMVSRQVTTKKNNPDPTTLFFKVEDRVIIFSRVEFALVSGLRFGNYSFDPYDAPEVDDESVHARLFGRSPNITPNQLLDVFSSREGIRGKVVKTDF